MGVAFSRRMIVWSRCGRSRFALHFWCYSMSHRGLAVCGDGTLSIHSLRAENWPGASRQSGGDRYSLELHLFLRLETCNAINNQYWIVGSVQGLEGMKELLRSWWDCNAKGNGWNECIGIWITDLGNRFPSLNWDIGIGFLSANVECFGFSSIRDCTTVEFRILTAWWTLSLPRVLFWIWHVRKTVLLTKIFLSNRNSTPSRLTIVALVPNW